jgi:serine/threonine protein kinase
MITAGQQIGGYTVLHLLGRGGMGEVYLAQHRRVARRAAIKVLVPELSQNAVVLERFFNEARSASLIRHPGIVEILDCDLYLGQAYIVMEFLEGESFGGYLYRTGPLDKDLAFFYGVATAVASAVGAAHATAIIHRDLKPDNIFLHLPSPTAPVVAVKILDFGIAKLAQQEGAHSQTGTGVLLGTPAYMSPEQCRGAGRVDNRSDMYSLGCIFYEALTGFPPFVREGFGDLIVAHVGEAPQPPRARGAAIEPELEALILRMLAKSPDDRPQSMDEVVTALTACARASNIDVSAPLRAKIPVERPVHKIEDAPTQPAAATPSGPSEVATTPSRARDGATPGGGGIPAPVNVATGRSGGVPRPVTPAPEGSTRRLVETVNESGAPSRRKPTTFGSTAAESIPQPRPRAGRWAVLGGAAVALIGGAIAIAGLRSKAPPPAPPVELTAAPGTSARAATAAPTPAAATPEAPPVAPGAEVPGKGGPSAAGRAVPTTAAAGPGDDTVRIDVNGAPAGTAAEVDGHATALPVQLPRGSQVHRITLRPPGEAARTIEVDGTRDRIVDLVLAKKRPASTTEGGAGSRDGTPTREGVIRRPGSGSHDRPRGADRAGGGEKKPAPGSSDRDVITDI